jgi:flagellar biosynthesis protein FlhB
MCTQLIWLWNLQKSGQLHLPEIVPIFLNSPNPQSMNAKNMVGALLTGILIFALGFLIFMLLLGQYFSENMIQYPGLFRTEPEYISLVLTCLSYACLLTYVFSAAGIAGIQKGFMAGAIIGLLVQINVDTYLYSQMHLMGKKLILIDVALNGLMSGIAGAFLGWWMGRGKTA